MTRWLLFVCVAAVVGAGCPDPCIFADACNVDDDCGDGRICRRQRSFEFGCSAVGGVCIDVESVATCGSAEGCGDDACCDPLTNTCVSVDRYSGPQCDALTCGDCDDAPLRAACSTVDDCGATEQCDDRRGAQVCVELCASSEECGAFARCTGNLCSEAVGAACKDVDDFDSCAGLDCIDLNILGQRTSAYCSVFCSDDRDCPPDMACDPGASECRRFF